MRASEPRTLKAAEMIVVVLSSVEVEEEDDEKADVSRSWRLAVPSGGHTLPLLPSIAVGANSRSTDALLSATLPIAAAGPLSESESVCIAIRHGAGPSAWLRGFAAKNDAKTPANAPVYPY